MKGDLTKATGLAPFMCKPSKKQILKAISIGGHYLSYIQQQGDWDASLWTEFEVNANP
ncbi:hypothetical protein BDR04DRAFT_1101092, partial [Suillus decipiens]